MNNKNLKRLETPNCPTLATAFMRLAEQIQGADLVSLKISRKPGKWPNSGPDRPYVGVAVVRA